MPSLQVAAPHCTYLHSHKLPLSFITILFTLPVTSFILAGHLEYVVTRLFGSISVDTVEGAEYRWVSTGIAISLCQTFID